MASEITPGAVRGDSCPPGRQGGARLKWGVLPLGLFNPRRDVSGRERPAERQVRGPPPGEIRTRKLPVRWEEHQRAVSGLVHSACPGMVYRRTIFGRLLFVATKFDAVTFDEQSVSASSFFEMVLTGILDAT